MKKVIASIISIIISMNLTVLPVKNAHKAIAFTSEKQTVATIQLAGIPNNSFLKPNTNYSFILTSSKSFNKIELRYYGREDINYNSNVLTYHVLGDYNYNLPKSATYETFNTYNASSGSLDHYLYPYYDPISNTFCKNNMVLVITHTDGTKTNYQVKSNVLYTCQDNLTYYSSRDTSFYYNNSTNSSFISAATEYYNNFPYVYNCLSYALHQEAAGWQWPFNTGSYQEVIDWLDIYQDYSQNTTSNHNWCRIIAYGDTSSIIHFARVTDWDANGVPIEINSKWGQWEVVHSNGIDTFADNSGLGQPKLYFNKNINNSDGITYCSVTGTYYDSTYKTWNSTTNSFDYIDTVFEYANTTLSSNETEKYVHSREPKQSPSELYDAYITYKNKIDNYQKSIENPISYVIMDDAAGAANKFIRTAVRYIPTIFDIASSDNYEDIDTRIAQFVIIRLLNAPFYYSDPNEYLAFGKKKLQDATNAVSSIGDNITATDCISLQEQYGYLIAPALKAIKKLHLLQLPGSYDYLNREQICELAMLFES